MATSTPDDTYVTEQGRSVNLNTGYSAVRTRYQTTRKANLINKLDAAIPQGIRERNLGRIQTRP